MAENKRPNFYVRFWAKSDLEQEPSWDVNHDGPLADARQAAEATLDKGTYPASRFTIHSGQTDEQVYP